MGRQDSKGGHALPRRRFLQLGAGALTSSALLSSCGRSSATPIGPGAPQVGAAERARRVSGATVVEKRLTAAPATVDLGGVQVQTWAFDGQLPGPEIRLARDEILRAELRNDLPQPTTIHWHGIALRNDMDGVPDLTQSPIAQQNSFSYEFAVPDSGTYFFHPHVRMQLDRGLYAPLIVTEPDDAGGHIDRTLVEEGQRVSAGEQIADMGNRGYSTGPHLHFEVHSPDGEKLSPQAWLEERAAMSGIVD